MSLRRRRRPHPVGDAPPDPPPAHGPDAAGDHQLLERIRRGDHAALGELYDRHCTAAYTLALVLGGDRAAAEALVHDTFLAVWTDDADAPGQRTVRCWLLSALSERAKQARNGGGRRPGALRDELLRQPGAFEVSDQRRAVTDAIAALRADEVEVVVVAMRCGIAIGQIADAVGRAPRTVGMQLNRGLRALTSVAGSRSSEARAET